MAKKGVIFIERDTMTYELTVICRDENDETAKKLIEKADGKILNVTDLGRKKFAYNIKKDSAGFYISYFFEMEPQNLLEIDKKLRLEPSIIRFLLISKKVAKEEVVKPRVEKKHVVEAEGEKITKDEPKDEMQEEAKIKTSKVEDKKLDDKETEVSKNLEKSAKTKRAVISNEKVEESKEVIVKKPVAQTKKDEVMVESKEKLETESEKEFEATEKERLKALEEKLSQLLKD